MTSNWRIIRAFLLSLALGVFASTLALGTFGFLLAGVPGFVNMAVWGVALGLVGGTLTGLTTMMSKYSEEIGGNFGRWQADEESKKTIH